MALQCKVPGCSNPADFRVHIYDLYNQSPNKPIIYHEPDQMTPHLCVQHAMLNEVNSGPRRYRDAPYPYTKRFEFRGWTVYSLLKSASEKAKRLFEFFPTRPTLASGPPISNRVRVALELGEIDLTATCTFEDCPLPPTFEVWKFQTHQGEPPLEPHGVGCVCQDHAAAIARKHPIGKSPRGFLVYRPTVAGEMQSPPELSGLLFEFDKPSEALLQKLRTMLSRAA